MLNSVFKFFKTVRLVWIDIHVVFAFVWLCLLLAKKDFDTLTRTFVHWPACAFCYWLCFDLEEAIENHFKSECLFPRGYLGFQVTGIIEWSRKSRPKKIPRASSKTQKKSLDQKLSPKKSHADFVALKSSRKG